MGVEVSLLQMLLVAFLLATVLGWLCERVHIPAFVGAVIAGLFLANFAVGSFDLSNALDLTDQSSVNYSALLVFFEIGLIFFVFTVGLKIRPAMLRAVAAPALKVAIVGVVVPFTLGAAFVLLAIGDQNVYSVLFIGTALAASSLGILSQLLHDHGMVDRHEGHLLLAAAVFEDVIAFVLLAIIVVLAGSKNSAYSVDFAVEVVIVVALAVSFVLAFLYLAGRLVRWLAPGSPDDPPPPAKARAGMLVIALLFCLGVAYLAASLQLAGILGAFFAGIAFAEIAPRYGIDRAFDALNAFFVPFFFVFVGLAVGSLENVLSIWLLVLLITVLAVVGKLLAGLAEQPSLGRTGALSVGTGLMARGEVALVIAVTAQYYGLLSEAYLGAIVVMAIATTIIGPILFHQVQLRARGEHARPPAGGPDAESAPEPAHGG